MPVSAQLRGYRCSGGAVMSTRAQICLKRDTEDFKDVGGIYIYKHCDGYPEGVMPVLGDIVSRFIRARGHDARYLLCQIVRQFAIEDSKGEYSPDKGYFTGWGLDTVEHGDIEYLYEVDAVSGKIYINGKPYKKKKEN